MRYEGYPVFLSDKNENVKIYKSKSKSKWTLRSRRGIVKPNCFTSLLVKELSIGDVQPHGNFWLDMSRQNFQIGSNGCICLKVYVIHHGCVGIVVPQVPRFDIVEGVKRPGFCIPAPRRGYGGMSSQSRTQPPRPFFVRAFVHQHLRNTETIHDTFPTVSVRKSTKSAGIPPTIIVRCSVAFFFAA